MSYDGAGGESEVVVTVGLLSFWVGARCNRLANQPVTGTIPGTIGLVGAGRTAVVGGVVEGTVTGLVARLSLATGVAVGGAMTVGTVVGAEGTETVGEVVGLGKAAG